MKKNSNRDLRLACKNKKDEFYTQLIDIEREMLYYQSFFQGKSIYCNCDNPLRSNFFKYFIIHFNTLKLKRLTASFYIPDAKAQGNVLQTDISSCNVIKENIPYGIEINKVSSGIQHCEPWATAVYKLMQNEENSIQMLLDNGDFRSHECIQLLKKADVVVTNPPFSLFREYIAQLMAYEKKFIVLGNQNAITYKEIFKLFKNNLMWLGGSIHSGDREFSIPDDYPMQAATSRIDENGTKFIRIKGVRWFTNVDYASRHSELKLYEQYNSKKYPFYDNYNAINIDKTKEIPLDYLGYMGVPITFMDKYSPEQFEVLGIMNTGEENKGIRLENTPHGRPLIRGKEKYLRIIIKRKANNSV